MRQLAIPALLPTLLPTLLIVTALSAPVRADTPLAFAWGPVAEPAHEGEVDPGRVAELVEFLLDHGWKPQRSADLITERSADTRSVSLGFDDPAGAARWIVPLLGLYRVPALVTATASELEDPELEGVLQVLAASPWVELIPRVTMAPAKAEIECRASNPPEATRDEHLRGLRTQLTRQIERISALTGSVPRAVAWDPGAWDGETEAIAQGLGLTVQLPTYIGVPPTLEGPRVGRYRLPEWAGVWAPVQASRSYDPATDPVRFVEVDPGWFCAGADPAARLERVLGVVRALGLNGVRLRAPSSASSLPTRNPASRGEVVGPLVTALRTAGVRWIAVDLPGDGSPDQLVAIATALARALDADVFIPPRHAPPQMIERIRSVRPGARIAWVGSSEHNFELDRRVDGSSPGERGLTIVARTPAVASRLAIDHAIDGWRWIGLELELAERGLSTSVRELAPFVLPAAVSADTPRRLD